MTIIFMKEVVPDSAFDIVCYLLGRVWNRLFVLVLSFVLHSVTCSRAAQKLAADFVDYFCALLFVMLKEKRNSKRTKN